MPRSIAAQPGNKCYLYTLPPELRVEIYRHVLTGHLNTIRLNSRFKEPGLLKVSKQIRDEAVAIFYGENTFYFTVQHWKPSRLQRLQRLTDRLQNNYGIDLDCNWLGEKPHWTNFKQCLRRLHVGNLRIPRAPCRIGDQHFGSCTKAAMVVELVLEMMEMMRGRAWKEVNDMLELHHALLAKCDERWL